MGDIVEMAIKKTKTTTLGSFSLIFFKPFREHVLLLEGKVGECCEKCFTSHVSSGYKEGSKRRKQKQREELKKKKATKASY